jgi:CubicO group peptidase (beta-lactamase class C family)
LSAQVRSDLSLEVRQDSELARSPALEKLRAGLTAYLSDGFPPSLSLAVVDHSGPVLQAFGGHACAIGEQVPTTLETSYDLASLTKMVCTVTLVLVARQRGALDLDDPVTRWLPRYPQEDATLRHLLTHTAGLVDHRPFHAYLHGREQIEAAIYEEARVAAPDSPVCYSDLGYMLLGWVLEECYDMGLEEAFAALVARPLGLTRTHFRPLADRQVAGAATAGGPAPANSEVANSEVANSEVASLRRIAATELDGDQRPGRGLIWGEVHDGNAYALGGVSGHAGLFAPMEDLARFVHSLLEPGAVLSPGSVALMSSRQAANGEDVRGIGWRLQPVGWGAWPEQTIWHTGFTGTSLLVAPELGVGVVLLTNSVYPHRRLEDQAAMRAHIHGLLAEALG